MGRAEFIYPDLDNLDSPLMSPFTSSLNGVPASAIAEDIFNDPDSWEESDDVDAGADTDPLAWLVEEIEKFKANSADIYGAFDSDLDNKRKPGLSPLTGEMRTGLKGIDRTSKIRPISIPCFFESTTPTHDEDIQDRLSKFLDASGIPHYVRPLSSDLTPLSTSKIAYYPSKINTSTVAGSNMDPSPIALHSSSITMSFLEWYGIYPESDQNFRSIRQQYRKSINAKKIATSMTPPPVHIMPPSPPLSMRPPGLEPPPHLPRSRSSTSISAQSPPYLRSRSPPAGSRPNSRSRSSSDSRSQSSTSTQDTFRRVSDGPARRRRLPSIPLEAPLLSPPPASPKLPSTEMPSQQPRPPSSSRPLPSISSPAGPRTRGSRVSSQDSTIRGSCLPHRPTLRL